MVLKAIREHRATRVFTGEAVPDETMRAILMAGRRAQSSKNSQPWQFVVVRERETLRQLGECGRWAGHLAGAAFGVALVTTARDSFDLGQAAAYLMLAAHEMGVASCLAAMWDEAKARAILGIPAENTFHYAISFGYAAGDQPVPGVTRGRKPLEDVVRWEKW